MKILKFIGVACVGLVIFAFAIPHFYPACGCGSKSPEGNIQLAGAYAALQQGKEEFGVFLPCLKYLGYDPSPEIKDRRYSIGFKRIEIHPKAIEKLKKIHPTIDMTKCMQADQRWFPNGKGPKVTFDMLPDESYLKINEDLSSEFKLFAIGVHDGKQWTMNYDQDKIYHLDTKKI